MSLIVFPAIDLKQGQVVRLAEGDMARATVYGDDPAAQAMLFADQGAAHLHVVDLDLDPGPHRSNLLLLLLLCRPVHRISVHDRPGRRIVDHPIDRRILRVPRRIPSSSSSFGG